MKLYLFALSVLLVLGGCTLDQGRQPEDVIAGVNYIALDGTPVVEGESLAEVERIHSAESGELSSDCTEEETHLFCNVDHSRCMQNPTRSSCDEDPNPPATPSAALPTM